MARILIAVDFSECGRDALAAGIGLAKDLGADIRLVHAFPEAMTAPVTAGLGYQEVFRQFASELETDEAVELTVEYADRARREGLDVEVLAESADPAELILHASEAEDVFMVVVGTRGKKGLRRFVMGSVAADVVRKAHKPVLVVPESK